jgi:hypothetical protein
MGEFKVINTIDAPIDQLWSRLTDIGSISERNPGVEKSYTTSEAATGLGAS